MILFDGEDSFGGDDAAHAVADENDMDRGFDGGRGRAIRDFKVYDFVLEPLRSMVRDHRWS